MAILTPSDVDYYRPSLLNLRGALGNILFINFIKANNAIPAYFKTSQEYAYFKDKNKEHNDCLFYACLVMFCIEINSILQSLKQKLIKLVYSQLIAYRREKLRRVQKYRAQAAFADTELEEQQRLQKEQEILEMLMSTPAFLLSHQTSLNSEQLHFYNMQNSIVKTLTRHTAVNEEYQKIMINLDTQNCSSNSIMVLKK